MIQYSNPNQRTIAEFDWPFHAALDAHNRWVKLSRCILWAALAQCYHKSFSSKRGRPAKDARLVIGAIIITHKLWLSDRETVSQVQENAYLQYFVELAGYQMKVPFVPSLLHERYGYYPAGDPTEGSHENRYYLKEKGIRFSGKPLGRPKQVTVANREELRCLKKHNIGQITCNAFR